MNSEATQHELPIEGKTYVVLKRKSCGPTGEAGAGAPTYRYSLDNGATWHAQIHSAYQQAKKDETLTMIGEPISEGGEYEAFALALFQEVSDLTAGERLILAKTDTQIVVLKESTVLAVRASTIDDVDFSTQEKHQE